MSNTNRNMTSRQSEFQLARLRYRLAELKEILAKKRSFNDQLEATLNACYSTFQSTNDAATKATNLHNGLIDAYEMVQNNLNAAIQKMRKDQDKVDKKQMEADKEMASKDEEIAKAEHEKQQLVEKLEQIDANDSKSRKEIDDLRAEIKKMQAEVEEEDYSRTDTAAAKEENVSTVEIGSSCVNLTQPRQRLMDINGIEQTEFLERYFSDAEHIKQESVTE